MIEGIRTFLKRIGESRMINSNNEKTRTGFLIGMMKAAKKCSKKYLIYRVLNSKPQPVSCSTISVNEFFKFGNAFLLS
jgi:hypothetical protein